MIEGYADWAVVSQVLFMLSVFGEANLAEDHISTKRMQNLRLSFT